MDYVQILAGAQLFFSATFTNGKTLKDRLCFKFAPMIFGALLMAKPIAGLIP